MARVPLAQATKPREVQKYFASEYGLNKVCGKGEINKEIVVVPLGLELGVYETWVHKVRAKEDGKTGFKSWYATNIVCHSCNADGEATEKATCCQLVDLEKEKHPDKNDSNKRLISRASKLVHIPVMVLGVGDMGKFNGKVPNELLNINTPLFSYLEVAGSTFEKDIAGGLRKQLETDGKITYEMSEEEAQDVVNKYLPYTLIRIKYVKSASYKYEKEYSFVPFYNKTIGLKTNAYGAIVQYRKNTELMNQINTYLTLFDNEQPKLVTEWTDAELKDYIVDSVERAENIQTAIKANETQALPKSQQLVEEIDDFGDDMSFTADTSEVTAPVTQPAIVEDVKPVDETEFDFGADDPVAASPLHEQTADVELTDSDVSFDLDGDDDFFSVDEDIDGID